MNATMSDAMFNVMAGVITITAPVIATFIVNALRKFSINRGIEIDQKNLQRIDQFLVNGLNFAASSAGRLRDLPAGMMTKEYIVQEALSYLETHGAQTLTALSADLDDPKVREAMRARIETLIADPTKPTPELLNPEKTTTVVAPTTAGS